MRFGMTLPTMVESYDRSTTVEWCRRIDDGPFASVSVGERLGYHNQEQVVLLAAAAALTSRVRIVATIVVLPMHPAALVAKQAATLDVLSGGRFTLGVGVGGREEDYVAAGAPFERRLARLDESVALMRRVWAGHAPYDGVHPVGPPPVQPAGPPILCSSMGPQSLARAARWADGIAGFTTGADPAELDRAAAAVRAAWRQAGRTDPPYLMTSAWCSLGADAPARHEGYARAYLASQAPLDDLIVPLATVHGDKAVAGAFAAARAAGFDEFMVVPTSSEVAELDRLAEMVAAS